MSTDSKQKLYQVDVTLTCTVRYDEDAMVYVAKCPALNIVTQGETYSESQAALHGAIQYHIDYFDRKNRTWN
jgi:predicted RNase H-like HicB family nuclease